MVWDMSPRLKPPTSVIRKMMFLRINEILFRFKSWSLRIISWYCFLNIKFVRIEIKRWRLGRLGIKGTYVTFVELFGVLWWLVWWVVCFFCSLICHKLSPWGLIALIVSQGFGVPNFWTDCSDKKGLDISRAASSPSISNMDLLEHLEYLESDRSNFLCQFYNISAVHSMCLLSHLDYTLFFIGNSVA